MTSTKKFARPTIQTPNEDPDPVGFAGMFPQFLAMLEQAYRARLRPFLRRFVLVRFDPAVHRRLLDEATARGQPITYYPAITVHPRGATGFARVVGKVETWPAGAWEDPPADQQSDDPEEEPYMLGLFTGEKIPLSAFKEMKRPKASWRRPRRR